MELTAAADADVRVDLASDSAEAWTVRLPDADALPGDTTVTVRVPCDVAAVLWPTAHGVLRRSAPAARTGWYRGAGRPGRPADPTQRLSLPFVVVETGGGRLLVGTDPGSALSVAADDRGVELSWTWLADAGDHREISRRVVVTGVERPEQALDAWHARALPGVPPGPSWRQDVRLTVFDYLSRDGQGWDLTLQALSDLVDPSDRHRAVVALHGWYDRIGRYCVDPDTGAVAESWTAFPYVNDPRLREFVEGLKVPAASPIAGHPTATWTFRDLDRRRPVPLDWDALRGRLQGAKDLGLRTVFYLACGLMAEGDPEQHIADGTGLEPAHGGLSASWVGPDFIGQAYLANPLHRGVRERWLHYVDVVLDKVGDVADALVIDEAYYVTADQLGPPACRGYAALAQASLLQEIARRCHTKRADLAFLTADLLGLPGVQHAAFPYSLWADGLYEDSWSWPTTWAANRFPAWRNPVWNCAWAPVSNLAHLEHAVLAEGAPLAWGQGLYGDDVGLADLTGELRERVGALWQAALRVRPGRQLPVEDCV